MPADDDGQFRHVRGREYERSKSLRMRDLTPLQKQAAAERRERERDADEWIKRLTATPKGKRAREDAWVNRLLRKVPTRY